MNFEIMKVGIFKFPSPYGVSFILIRLYMNYVELYDFEFQSPYEVIFTFILYSKKNCIIINF